MAKININAKPFQNVDPSNLTGDQAEDAYNCYLNELGRTVSRFGLLAYITITSGVNPIDGMYWWDAKSYALTVDSGKSKTLDINGNVTNHTNALLETGERVTFAENASYVLMANGAKMSYTDGTTMTQVASAAPVTVSHVAFIDQYAICNKVGTGRFYFADFTGEPSTWVSTDFYTAESSPDNLIALTVLNNEIMLFGDENLEHWQSDSRGPFSRINSKIFQYGIIAKHSLVNTGQEVYWLSNKRRIIKSSGGVPTEISTPFDKTFGKITTVSDCTADYVIQEGQNFIIFNFKTENRTFMYNITTDSWSEISWWDKVTAQHRAWLGNNYLYCPDWNQHLVGSRKTGLIYKLDKTYYTDNTDNIYFQKTSGNDDQGTKKWKMCPKVIFTLRRGVGISGDLTTVPKLLVRYRDNGSKTWSNSREISLGKIGEYDSIIETYDWGQFKSRQWQAYTTAKVPIEIIDMEADIEVLE